MKLLAASLALIGLAACSPQPSPTAPETVDTVAAHAPPPEGDEAVECLGYLALEIETLRKAKPPGDTAPFETAYKAWRTKAESLLPPAELEPYFNSVLAVVGSVPAKERGIKISNCLVNAPKQ